LTVLLFERYPVDAAHVSRFEELAAERLRALRSCEGNLWADVARAGDDEPSFVLLSEWRTPGDADAAPPGADPAFDVVLRGDVTQRRFGSAHS
jgi:quinol monooxygenase YgiN